MEGALSPFESLPGPFLKLPGWGGDHCGSDLALSCSYPCQLAATSVSPTLTVPQDLSACYRGATSARPPWPRVWKGGPGLGPGWEAGLEGSCVGLALTLLPMEGRGLVGRVSWKV